MCLVILCFTTSSSLFYYVGTDVWFILFFEPCRSTACVKLDRKIAKDLLKFTEFGLRPIEEKKETKAYIDPTKSLS